MATTSAKKADDKAKQTMEQAQIATQAAQPFPDKDTA